jgi:hypothetical protein
MTIGAGILSQAFPSDGIGGSYSAEERSERYVEEIHPIRNLDRPELVRHELRFTCGPGETIEGYKRGIGNVFVLTGIQENDPDFSISLYSQAKNKGGDLMVTYAGDVACRYKVAQYIWNMALLFDIQQAENLYYSFTSKKNKSFNFVITLLGIRIR